MASKSEKASHHLGGGKKSKKHKVHAVHIRKSANGGYIAENHHEPPDAGTMEPPTPPEEHTYPDLAGAQGHLAEHMGEEQEQEPQGGAGGGAAAAMMGAGGGGGAQ